MIIRHFRDRHHGWYRSLLRLCLMLTLAAMLTAFAATGMFGPQQQAQAAAANNVGICYQAHVQNIGWQRPVCNGDEAGTTGQGLRMEALRVWLTRPVGWMRVCYQAHVQNIGWQPWVCNGQQAGTTGRSLRIEALRIVLIHAPDNWDVCYKAHVENSGWQDSVCNGDEAGTTGQSLRLEAIQISLSRSDD